MLKLHPSPTLRGYDSERSPFCPAPWSHAAIQHPRSNYTAGRPAVPGEVSHPRNLSVYNGHLAEQVARGSAAITSLGVEFGLQPLRVPPCHASWGTLEASRAVLAWGGCILSCWLPLPGCKFLEGQGPFKLTPGSHH